MKYSTILNAEIIANLKYNTSDLFNENIRKIIVTGIFSDTL